MSEVQSPILCIFESCVVEVVLSSWPVAHVRVEAPESGSVLVFEET